MIEIEVSKDGYKVKIDNIMDGNLIMEIIKEVKTGRLVYMPMASPEASIGTSVEPKDSKDAVINIRDRLPNLTKATVQNGKETDIVDIKKKSAEVSSHRYFRCPECGQSHVAVVGSDIVVRDIDEYDKNSDDQPLYIVKNVEATEPYEVLSKNAIDRVKGLVGDGELEGYCPRCDKSNILEKWFDAWINPESYFDHERPCPLCGDEMMMAITTDKPNKPWFQCENRECNYKMEEK